MRGAGRDVRQAGREEVDRPTQLGGRIQEREVLMSERGSQGGMSFGEGELDEERSS